MKLDLPVLWRHYSSWILYAIVALGGIQEAGVQITGLPRWATSALAACALIAKVIPQPKRTPDQPHEGPGTSDSIAEICPNPTKRNAMSIASELSSLHAWIDRLLSHGVPPEVIAEGKALAGAVLPIAEQVAAPVIEKAIQAEVSPELAPVAVVVAGPARPPTTFGGFGVILPPWWRGGLLPFRRQHPAQFRRG